MKDEESSMVRQKFSNLIASLQNMDGAVLAFSGGVDSAFLLKAMKVSGIRMLAVTGVSETMPGKDLERALSFAEELGVDHKKIQTEELLLEEFISNPPDRCFFCKDELFRKLKDIAVKDNYGFVLDGTNADDRLDYRPGKRAAALHGIRSPLAETGFTKNEIRQMSKELGLAMWDHPSSPCLSSRFPYGQRITIESLARIEQAEEFLRSFGIEDVRVRDHGDTARIEVNGTDMDKLMSPERRRLVTERLKDLGYRFVSLDLEGYKSGSMNRVLENNVSDL